MEISKTGFYVAGILATCKSSSRHLFGNVCPQRFLCAQPCFVLGVGFFFNGTFFLKKD